MRTCKTRSHEAPSERNKTDGLLKPVNACCELLDKPLGRLKKLPLFLLRGRLKVTATYS